MSAQSFGKNQPALGLGENSCIFFGSLVIDNRQSAVKGMTVVRRIHQDGSVFGVQMLIDSF